MLRAENVQLEIYLVMQFVGSVMLILQFCPVEVSGVKDGRLEMFVFLICGELCLFSITFALG
jgi:hypothetical protein